MGTYISLGGRRTEFLRSLLEGDFRELLGRLRILRCSLPARSVGYRKVDD